MEDTISIWLPRLLDIHNKRHNDCSLYNLLDNRGCRHCSYNTSLFGAAYFGCMKSRLEKKVK